MHAGRLSLFEVLLDFSGKEDEQKNQNGPLLVRVRDPDIS